MAGPEDDGAVIIMDRVVTCRLSWWVWDVAMRRGKSVSGGVKMGEILRDGIASGRGVHRKMGVLIQKSRSLFRGKMGNLRIFGILGVGVV